MQDLDRHEYFLYGRHAVLAALGNARRQIDYCLALPSAVEEVKPIANQRGVEVRITDKDKLANLLKIGDNRIVHQGLVLCVKKLKPPSLPELLDNLPNPQQAVIVIADRVSDPQNIGAILRNMWSFGASGVSGGLILPSRHAPSESASLAKAAAGALEHVPLLHEVNLSQSLKLLKQHGFWCYGLAEDGESDLAHTTFADLSVIVLGSEGAGIRPLVKQNCDAVVRIPMSDSADSLNVATSSAIALYHRYITTNKTNKN